MPRKTVFLIISLFVITVVLLTIALRSNRTANQDQTNGQPEITQTPAIAPQAATEMMLTPDIVQLAGSSNGSIDVTIDSHVNEITAVQIELQYDPKALTNVKIESGDFLKQSIQLINDVNATAGRITYAIGITPAQRPVRGAGIVAKITFTKLPRTTAQQTEIKLLPTSLVTSSGIDKSVLKLTKNTTITF
jgi:hypothetical protein